MSRLEGALGVMPRARRAPLVSGAAMALTQTAAARTAKTVVNCIFVWVIELCDCWVKMGVGFDGMRNEKIAANAGLL